MGKGKKLQALLKEKNISVTSLARETDISQNTLYAIIKRDSEINASTMSKISDALHMSIDELSDLLSETNSQNETQPTSRILEIDVEKTLKDTRQIIDKLNHLTQEYERSIYQLNTTKEQIESLKRRKAQIEKEISDLEYHVSILENDIKNRELELSLIRNKLE